MPSIAKRLQSQLNRSRVTLFSLMLPLAAASWSILGFLEGGLRLLYIVLGFSLIIFLHELGHFAVARACSVKCLAFSIGIGPRMLGWRKHGGFSFGSDPWDPDLAKEKEAKRKKEDPPAQKHPVSAVQSDLPTTAHEPKHPRDVGDCDYRLSWLPLGGYVRMLGQDDMDPNKQSTDPRSFGRRPIWQRMCIVSAGVIMNIIFAAVCFSIIFSPGIGVDFPPARIGNVVYNSPAWGAKFRPGDEVLAIDNKPYRGFLEFADVAMAAALSDGKTPVVYKVKHFDGTIEDLKVVAERSPDTGLLAIGVEPMPSVRLLGKPEDVQEEYAEAGKEGVKLKPWQAVNKSDFMKFRKGDAISAIDGTPVQGNYMQLYQRIQELNGKAVQLTLANKDKALTETTINIVPHLEVRKGVSGYPSVLGLSPRWMIAALAKNGEAEKNGVKIYDRIIRVGDRAYPTAEQLIQTVTTSNGAPLELVVEREGSNSPITFKLTPRLTKGAFKIGVGPDQDIEHATFIPPEPQTLVGGLNLPKDAVISKIDGEPVKTWEDIYRILRSRSAGTVNVTFATGSGEVSQALPFSAEEETAVKQTLHYLLGLRLENETRTQAGENTGQAVMMGLDHTKKFILNVYMTLWGLAHRTVDPSNLHGIVGITKIGYDVQERGTVWLWYVLAMVSVNLAVANFLPLPIVDGGLFLLLILEKIRGKPLSMKIQSAIQTVGIVLLASLFIFVTYNDITGLFLK